MHRRALLSGLAATALGAAAGCLGSVGPGGGTVTPAPVDLSGQKQDDQGGMVIGLHGGPNGQIFYAEHSPEGHENPAWFHTLSYGLFPYYLEHRELGWEATAIYATDYSRVDWELADSDGPPVISSPTAPETFGDATQLTYVVESDVVGGMGPDLIPFSDAADVESFVDDHGGRTMAFDDVTPGFLAGYTQ